MKLFKVAFEKRKYWEKDVEGSDKLNLTKKQTHYVTDTWTFSYCLTEIKNLCSTMEAMMKTVKLTKLGTPSTQPITKRKLKVNLCVI